MATCCTIRYMDYIETIRIEADPSRAWQALSAVDTYPQRTTSMTDLKGLDGPDLAVGHRFQIRQPGFPAAVWRVSDVRAGESFHWESKVPGLLSVATHRVSANPDGSTQVVLTLRQTGALAGLLAALTKTKTRRYMALEAAGVKAAAES